jgi:hypothetical protein
VEIGLRGSSRQAARRDGPAHLRGVLDKGESSDGLGSDSYWVTVRYDYDGETVTAHVAMSREDQERYTVGRRVGLTYAPSRPKVVALDPLQW